MSNWQETDQPVLDNMTEWTKLLKEKIFDKETEYVPHAVAIMAAVDFIVDRIDQSDVVRPEHIIQILQDRFFEKEVVSLNPTKRSQGDN